jgi:hypothetical protein
MDDKRREQMKAEVGAMYDNMLFATRRYLAASREQDFKELFQLMRGYWSYIHNETCPYHLLTKVKKKGE